MILRKKVSRQLKFSWNSLEKQLEDLNDPFLTLSGIKFQLKRALRMVQKIERLNHYKFRNSAD